jgi:cyclic pyranopterin phosphate synthase
MSGTAGTPRDGAKPRLTHIDEHGKAHMVDVTGKGVTRRVAEARCTVVTPAEGAAVLASRPGAHDLVEMARSAGVQAAKLTSTLIPLCHPLLIDRSVVDVAVVDGGVAVRAVTTVAGRTGVEIEALTACAVASLVLIQTFFDHDPETSVEGLTVWHKSGGRSGTWERDGQNDGVRLVEK